MSKIIVTGAAGLVGQNLVPLLIDAGHDVYAIDKNQHNLSLLGDHAPVAHCILADLVTKGDWADHFEGVDCVILLHAQISGQNEKIFVDNNVTSVQNVLDVCHEKNIKNLIHISSSVVLSVAKDDYTNTKRAGEECVKKGRVPYTILRPPLMYGCFDAKHLGWITAFMKKSPVVPIPEKGDYFRQPLFVMDLCHIIVKLVQKKPLNETWDIIGHEKIPYIELLKKIAKANHLKRVFVPMPLPLFGVMLSVYSAVMRKISFTPDQMKALVAGDEFKVTDWSRVFGVPYTTFDEGLKIIMNSKCRDYNTRMVSPH